MILFHYSGDEHMHILVNSLASATYEFKPDQSDYRIHDIDLPHISELPNFDILEPIAHAGVQSTSDLANDHPLVDHFDDLDGDCGGCK